MYHWLRTIHPSIQALGAERGAALVRGLVGRVPRVARLPLHRRHGAGGGALTPTLFFLTKSLMIRCLFESCSVFEKRPDEGCRHTLVGRRRGMAEKSAPRRRSSSTVSSRYLSDGTPTAVSSPVASSRCSSDMEANGARTVLSGLAAAMGFNGERTSIVGAVRRASASPVGVRALSEEAASLSSDPSQPTALPRRRRCSLGSLMPSSQSGGAGSCGGEKRTNMLCARLESVASMLEARSAAVGEAQLRAILLEHQSALEAQQQAQARIYISAHLPVSPHISRGAAASAGQDA